MKGIFWSLPLAWLVLFSFPIEREVECGEGGRQMGWWMLIWVVVIVGTPTILWFLLPEKERK
jgi:hypothetical protein